MPFGRVATGIPGLDKILGGGLPAASINLVSGVPGGGKTVLAQQVVYSAAAPDRPALYFSTVAEPYEKIIVHVQSFGFFRRDYPGRVIHYRDLGRALATGGVEAALAVIREEVSKYLPGFVVIDSFRAIEGLSSSDREMAVFLYELSGTLSALDCVTFLLDESPIDKLLTSRASAVADGIVNIDYEPSGRSGRRSLQILKLRGSAFLPGSHLFVIDGAGAVVYPRLGSITPAPVGATDGCCATGIAGLDEHLSGGVLRGTTTLVSGPVGSGKTVFALSFLLQGAAAGEPGVFASFQESPLRLKQVGSNFGWDPETLEANRLLVMFHTPPLDVEVDRFGHLLLEAVDSVGARRVVLDAVSDLSTQAIPEDDYQAFLYTISQLLQGRGVTTVMTTTTLGPYGAVAPRKVSGERLADFALHLELLSPDNGSRRVLRVLKSRGLSASVRALPFTIEEGSGFVVGS
ncbi:MAG: hypothetical protein C4551_09170 [Bacillota bacterium]|nr:MAG: hypothetical protein C4551_09170 [Bacillota bacterium]